MAPFVKTEWGEKAYALMERVKSLLDPQGIPTITQFAQASAVATTSQNGSPSAQLTSVSIADGGNIVGIFSDGQTKVLARIALATFVSPLTLAAVGNNLFIVSSTSGTPAIGTPDTGGRGSVVGAALEFSNVDIAREFTNLMTAQCQGPVFDHFRNAGVEVLKGMRAILDAQIDALSREARKGTKIPVE